MIDNRLPNLLRTELGKVSNRPLNWQRLHDTLRRRKRRRQVRRASIALACCVIIMWNIVRDHMPVSGTGSNAITRSSPQATRGEDSTVHADSPVDSTDSAGLSTDLETLEDRISIQRQVVSRIMVLDRIERARKRLSQLGETDDPRLTSPEFQRRYQYHRTAALAMLHADRLKRDPQSHEEALAEYTWIAQHFANTSWAHRAQRATRDLRNSF